MIRKTLRLLFALLLGSPLLFAQGQGSLVGTVRDTTGGLVPNTKVVATRVDTGIPFETTTNSDGDFIFPELPVGIFAVSFTANGFRELKVERIEIHIASTVRQDVTLEVQKTSTSVEVTASTPMVKSESAEIGSLVAAQQITELPLNGRDAYDLLRLSAGSESGPGASVPFEINPATMPTMAGGRGGYTMFTLDGANITSENLPGAGIVPILDAVQEFRAIAQLAPASMGSMSVVTVATKSGGNDFHGTLYEFLRNNVLDAQPYFEQTINTPAFSSSQNQLRYNQFGGTIGGPIVKDRTFFFGGVEVLREQNLSQTTRLMPSTAELGGDFSGVNPVTQQPFAPIINPQTGEQFAGNNMSGFIDTKSQAMAQDFFRAPNCQACLNAGLGFNYVGEAPGYSRYERYLGRVDHRISEADNLFFSFQYNPEDSIIIPSPVSPAEPVHEPSPSGVYTLGWSYIFTPTLLNEAHLSFFRTKQDLEQVGNANGAFQFNNTPFTSPDVFPMDIISGYPGVYGNQLFSQAIYIVEEHGSASDELTWMHGHHQFKLGGEAIRDHFYVRNALNSVFVYGDNLPSTWGFTGNAMSDLLLGVPEEGITYQGTGRASLVDRDRTNLYFQDDWNVSSKVTMNLGLRWDWFQRWHDSNTTLNRLGTLDLSPASYAIGGRYLMAGSPNYYVTGQGVVQGSGAPLVRSQIVDPELSDFQPRIGLAYRPFDNNKTAIRAGYGIYYYVQWANALSFTETDPPFEFEVAQLNVPPAVPVGQPYTVDTLFPSLLTTGAGGTGLDIHNRDPRVQEWAFSIQQQLKNSILLSAEYVGNHSQHNLFSLYINEPPLPNAQQLTQLEASPSLDTTLALGRLPLPKVAETYEYDVNNADSWYDALNLKAEGRLHQRLYFSSVYTWSKSLDQTSEDNEEPVTSYNLRIAKGYAEFDHRNRFVSSAVYDLPFGDHLFVPNNAAAKKLVSGWEITGISTFESGAPFTVSMGVDTSFRGGMPVYPIMTGPPVRSNIRATNGIYLTPQNFAAPAWGTLNGMIPRNFFHGPGVNNFDLGFVKNTALNDKLRLQFRAEMFDAFNHAQFNMANQTLAYGISAPSEGETLPQVDYLPASAFGRVVARPTRVVQFALKLVF